MPDITMCKGNGCILRGTCYRFKAVPDMYQSYFMGSVNNDDNTCDYYWKMKNKFNNEKKSNI